MTKLVLLRHAQSFHNANAIIGGNPELTETGRGQAEQAGRNLHEKYGDGFNFMVISGMLRTNQTAAIINPFLKIDNIYYNEKLQEKHYGIYENKDLNEHRSTIHLQNYNETFPGGESDAIFAARITKALCGYLKGKESLALLVMHAYAIEMATQYFLGKAEYLQNAAFIELDLADIHDFAGKCAMASDYIIEL